MTPVSSPSHGRRTARQSVPCSAGTLLGVAWNGRAGTRRRCPRRSIRGLPTGSSMPFAVGGCGCAAGPRRAYFGATFRTDPAARRTAAEVHPSYMCGFAAIIDLRGNPVPDLERRLRVMNDLIAHRGPDDSGVWVSPAGSRRARSSPALDHRRRARRSSRCPTRPAASSPTTARSTTTSSCAASSAATPSARSCDTEVVLRSLRALGRSSALQRLRGMFAFAIWDEQAERAASARATASASSRSTTPGRATCFYFASEAKALMPFLPAIETDPDGLEDYLAFQFCLAGKTLFKGVQRAAAGPLRCASRTGRCVAERYWEVHYDLDFDHTERYFEERERGAARRSRSPITCAATSRSPPTSPAASTQARSATLAGRARRAGHGGLHRQVP